MLGIIKFNWRLLANKGYWVGWLFIILSSIFIDFNFYSQMEMYELSERVFSLLGILWLGSILLMDRKREVKEILFQSRINQVKILIIRWSIMICSLMMAYLMTLFIAKFSGAEFNFMKTWLTCMTNSLFLGSLALLFTQITGEAVIGYIISFVYYYFELSTKGQHTGRFSIMSASIGEQESKLYLFALTLPIIICIIGLHNKSTKRVK